MTEAIESVRRQSYREWEICITVDREPEEILSPDALHHIVEVLQTQRADLLYTDEDMLGSDNNRVRPRFKPDWSKHFLLSCIDMGHLLVVKRSFFESVQGFRSVLNGAGDHDLIRRLM